MTDSDFGGFGSERADPEEPTLLLANPRGFCAGVRRAIRIVEAALEREGPVYVRHQIVHNRAVVEELRAKGAIFVEEICEVPDGATVVFSAHGVPASVSMAAYRRGLDVIDATCPLVDKVHREVRAHVRAGRHVALIGHQGHPEVVGIMGQVPDGSVTLIQHIDDLGALPGDAPIGFATQTTLSEEDASDVIAALLAARPDAVGPALADICYATTNRQRAVRTLSAAVDAIIVVGSANSSNSRRLKELAERMGRHAQLVEGSGEIDWKPLRQIRRIGVTAGASAPEASVREVVRALRDRLGIACIQEMPGQTEPASFAMPARFRHAEQESDR